MPFVFPVLAAVYSRSSTINDIVSVYGAGGNKRTIVFCTTKRDCNELCMDPKVGKGGVQKAPTE